MKLLLVAPLPPPVGGIQSVTVNMINYVEANQTDARLTVYNTSHRLRPITSESKLMRLYTGISNSLKTYFDVGRIMKRDMPDLVHLASSSSLALIKDLLIIRAGKRRNVPVVVHWHFGRIPALRARKNWEWKMLMRVIRQSSRSVVIDDPSYGALIDEGCANVSCVPNPLSQEVERRARELQQEKPGRRKGGVLYVGHVLRKKGVYELVEACTATSLVEELVLIGPYEEQVRNELAKIAGARDNGRWLVFKGQQGQDQVLAHMARFPVLALPSHTEGFPMVVLEAMAMGCAVVATDVGAIPDMLAVNTETPCGICVPVKDPATLGEAVVSLMSGTGKRELFSARATERVLEQYTMQKVFAAYTRVWNQVVSSKS
ncbi:MAG: glycosyltransferase family 4 protein [Prolixibacteraceae bacterium]